MSTPKIKEEPAATEPAAHSNDAQDQDVEMTDAAEQGVSTPVTEEEHTHREDEEGEAEKSPEIDYVAESKKIEEKAKMYLARQTKPVIIPAFAAWFSIDDIHEIEKRSLPEFFNNNSRFKTDKIYKDIRNFMINTFRLNPVEYLTVTAARRNIAADVASIIRIHAFLEQWGLINYQINPKTKPSLVGPQYTGHFQIILDTPDGLKPFIPQGAKIVKHEQSPETDYTDEVKTAVITEESIAKDPLNLTLRKNTFDSTHDALSFGNGDRATSVQNKSFTCSVTGNDSTDVRYHNLKTKGYISARAFKEGHFGSNFTSADFVRLEKLSKNNIASKWTDQETLLLLEGIEMFEDNWDKISAHVGSKTKEQCITKFIQLPIEDKYLVRSIAHVKKQDTTTKSTTDSTNESVIKTIKFLIKNLDGDLASRDFLENDEDFQKAVKLTVGSLVGGAQAEQQNLKQESTDLLKNLVDLEISKIEHKLSKISLLEKQLNQEKAELAQQRKDVVLDRLALKKQAVDVRSKLAQAAAAENPEVGSQLAEEAVAIASKAPRVSVIATKPIEETIDEDSKDKEAVEKAEEVVPVSQSSPEEFQYWKL